MCSSTQTLQTSAGLVEEWPDYWRMFGARVKGQAVERGKTAHAPPDVFRSFRKAHSDWKYECISSRVKLLFFFKFLFYFKLRGVLLPAAPRLDLQRLGRANCSCVQCEGADWQVLWSLLCIDWPTTKLSFQCIIHSTLRWYVLWVTDIVVKWTTLCHHSSYDGRDGDGPLKEVTW